MKTTLTVLIVAIVVALAWALRQDPEEQASIAPASPATEEVEATSSKVDLVEEDREAAEARTQRTVVAEVPIDRATGTRFDPSTAASLEVLLVAKESNAPLPGVGLRVLATEDGARVEAEWAERRDGEGSPHTDDQGRARFVLSSGASIQILVFGRGGRVATTSRHLEPLASGEARTVRLEIPTRTDAHFVGRVVDAESGKPIPGARVHVPGRRLFVGGGGSPWSGTSLTRPDVSTTSNEADQEFRTGPEGWFEVTLPTGRRQAWQVDAKGFGPKMFQPDGSHGDRERALVVRLQRAATLRGRIQGAPDLAELVVLAKAHGFEFSMGPGAGSLDALQRRARVHVDGTWVMNDLPPGAGLKLELLRGETVVRREPHRHYLEPGEERNLEWSLGSGATLHGRAVIADTNAPVPARSIWLVPASEVLGLLTIYRQPVAQAVTDDEGFFAFPDVPPGEWAVGPAPSDSRDDEGGDVAPTATRVSVPTDVWTVEVELRLHRGLFITGEVLRPDGELAGGAYVNGHNEEADVRDYGIAAGGAFRIGPLVPGSYRLTAQGGVGTSTSEPVTAMAGDVDVVLQLNAGGAIQGRLVDPASGESVQGRIKVTNEERSGGVSTRTRPDGSFSLVGLAFGSYTATGSSGDLAGSVKGVVIGPSQSVADVEVPLEPGAVLLIKYTGEQAFAHHHVSVGGSRWGMGRYERGQASRTVRVPGEVVVIVSYETPDGESHTVERTVDLVAGEETKVEVGDE
jgi:hypothetical protein